MDLYYRPFHPDAHDAYAADYAEWLTSAGDTPLFLKDVPEPKSVEWVRAHAHLLEHGCQETPCAMDWTGPAIA